jgi:hypothetical protein
VRDRFVEIVDTEDEEASDAAERDRARLGPSLLSSMSRLRFRLRSAAICANCSSATPFLVDNISIIP